MAGEEKVTTKNSTQTLNHILATFFAFWKLLWGIKAALESTGWSRSCSDTLGYPQHSRELLYLPKTNPPSSCSQV